MKRVKARGNCLTIYMTMMRQLCTNPYAMCYQKLCTFNASSYLLKVYICIVTFPFFHFCITYWSRYCLKLFSCRKLFSRVDFYQHKKFQPLRTQPSKPSPLHIIIKMFGAQFNMSSKPSFITFDNSIRVTSESSEFITLNQIWFLRNPSTSSDSKTKNTKEDLGKPSWKSW